MLLWDGDDSSVNVYISCCFVNLVELDLLHFDLDDFLNDLGDLDKLFLDFVDGDEFLDDQLGGNRQLDGDEDGFLDLDDSWSLEDLRD